MAGITVVVGDVEVNGVTKMIFASGTVATFTSDGAVELSALGDGSGVNEPTADEKAALDAASVALAAGNPVASAADLEPVFYTYDFAIDGGGTGTILLDGPTIPANVFVNAAFVQVVTPFGSGGAATVALTTGEVANDIQTAVAFNNAALAAGMHFPAVHKLTTGTRAPAIVIAGAALNAGKVKITLDTIPGWG